MSELQKAIEITNILFQDFAITDYGKLIICLWNVKQEFATLQAENERLKSNYESAC